MKQGLLPWKPELKTKAKRWEDAVAGMEDSTEVERALLSLSRDHYFAVIEGMRQLHQVRYHRVIEDMPVIWKEGSTTIHCYEPLGSGQSKGTLLFVPSLINRHYIFDISEERSMVRHFQEQGYRCLLINWNDVGEEEEHFCVDDYIARIGCALSAIASAKHPVTLVGYCMGGMMAMALSQLYTSFVERLVLIATPWDFHASDVQRVLMNIQTREWCNATFSVDKRMSGVDVHHILYMLDPWAVNDKYAHFSTVAKSSREAKSFVEREYWLHDNVDLSGAVAQQIFVQWALDNTPLQGSWKVSGEVIDPSYIAAPTFIAISPHDKIVPPHCSLPLSMKIPHSEVVYPRTGHVGMVAGVNAKKNLWIPIESWLNTH